MEDGRRVVCPYCKVPMEYYMEVEKLGGTRRITRYYRCPVCSAKLIDEVLEVSYMEDRVVVRILSNGVRRLVGGPRYRQSRRPQARRIARRHS